MASPTEGSNAQEGHRLTVATSKLNGFTGRDPTDLDSRSPIMMTWRNRAACLDEGPELFFPIGNTGPALVQIEEAKGVCGRCEVVADCLSWAIDFGQDAGVWGGLSDDERRALKRRNAHVRCAS
jgi:Transcription factor WhiB.